MVHCKQICAYADVLNADDNLQTESILQQPFSYNNHDVHADTMQCNGQTQIGLNAGY